MCICACVYMKSCLFILLLMVLLAVGTSGAGSRKSGEAGEPEEGFARDAGMDDPGR